MDATLDARGAENRPHAAFVCALTYDERISFWSTR